MFKHIIIGASGSIGKKLYSVLKNKHQNTVGTYFSSPIKGLVKFDISSDDILDIFPEIDAHSIIYLLSAKTSPNWVYQNSILSRHLNVESAQRMIKAISARKATIVYLSSSMVFDGEVGNYTETSKTHPLNLYGKQKVEMENYLQLQNEKNIIIRTDSVITQLVGDNCPVEKLYQSLYQGNAKMAYDNLISLIDVTDLCQIIVELVEQKIQGIFHIGSSGHYSKVEIAEWIIEASCYKDRMYYEQVSFSEIPFPEGRPTASYLNSSTISNQLKYITSDIETLIKYKVKLIDDAIKHSN